MSPLVFEMRQLKKWVELGRLGPEDTNGSLSHNGPAGRQVYMFGCHGDHSVIKRSEAGVDTDVGPLRITAALGYEEIARLTEESAPYEFWLKTDNMREPILVRFRHEEP